MEQQLVEPSEKTKRFLRDLFAEYGRMSDAQRKSNRNEYAIFFNIGYINGCYYDFEQIRSYADELIKAGYLGSFSRPGYETAFAVFTPEGLEYCYAAFGK